MKKILFILAAITIGLFFLQTSALAQDDQTKYFQAEIIKILDERLYQDESGQQSWQQNLELIDQQGKVFTIEGIHDFNVIAKNHYQVNDKVIVSQEVDVDGQEVFFILDYVRTGSLWWLTIVFALTVIIVGRQQGGRSLLALALSIVVIIYFIVPQILAGQNPLAITVIGGSVLMSAGIYLTHGWNKKSHLINAAILISLIITGGLSWLFTDLARLTGFVSEEAMYLANFYNGQINLRGLLLAGIIIGALGALDDVVTSQVSAVQELREANPNLTPNQIFVKAMRIGVDHISSMTNTLFFAYVSASLPLIILFSLKEPPLMTFSQVINSELIATEIVRALVGSIGLILSAPLATFLASRQK